MKRMLTRAALGGLALLLTTGSAVSAPTVTMTSPADGSTISRSQTPSLSLGGAVSFETPAATTSRFYLRRSACGGTADPGMRLSRTNGTDAGTGCGYVGGWNLLGTADEASFVMNFPAADGLPFTLDTSRQLAGKISMDSYRGVAGSPVAIAAGNATLKITISGETNQGSQTLGIQSITKTITPTTGLQSYDFAITVPAGLDKKDFTGLNINLSMTGPGVGHGYVNHSGASYMDVPTFSASFDRKVQIAINSGAFSSTGVALSGDLSTWSATTGTPAAGSHFIKAQAVQGGIPSGIAQNVLHVTA